MNIFFSQLRPTIVFLTLFTGIFGVAYPLVSTVLIQGLFPEKAGGSLLIKDGIILGSELIGQQFTQEKYFWSRPSVASYNAAASSGSNLSPANPALLEAVKARVVALGSGKDIPVDLVTSSGSGLDPHISPAAANYQIKRVAAARGMSEAQLHDFIERYSEGRQFGFLGEKTVNVLKLNLALDGKL